MKIEDIISRYKKKIKYKTSTMNDFKESNDPELLFTVSIYIKEIEELELIVSALEKQHVSKPPNGDLDTSWTCPGCGCEVYNEQQRMHCKQCGQLIAWDKL